MRHLKGESDIFVGRRGRLDRYLVCAMQGHFPVAVRTGPDAITAVVRTGAPHVGISGTLAIVRSMDGGRSWTDPVEALPRWDDYRNPALGANGAGELVLACWRASQQAYADEDGRGLGYRGGQEAPDVPALYHAISVDGGDTWGGFAPYRSERLTLASPYGRIIRLPDGVMLMGIYGTPRDPEAKRRNISVLARSYDGGRTWGDEILVARGYNETAFVALPGGRLLAAARSESGHVAVLHSDDLGRTWSQPEQITRDGEHPADLTVLQSGRVLFTFGRRIRPLGCGALFSDDGGRSWDRVHEVLLAGDGVESTDLGYPSTVQLADGHIVTLLYYASGSEMSEPLRGWGRVSCHAIHYLEGDISPERGD